MLTSRLILSLIIRTNIFHSKFEFFTNMASITITGSNPSNGELILSDHGNTEAKRGEVVTWVISPKSGVNSITGIKIKDNSTNIFEKEPSQAGNSRNWKGVINNTLQIPATGAYSIFWSDESGENHEFDPLIQVNS